MKSALKFEISQSIKTISFLDITLNQQTLSATVFAKPTNAYAYCNPKSCHHEHMTTNIPKLQFLRLRKICSDALDYIKKSNEYQFFFTKQGSDSSRLKVLTKDILAKTRDELLLQNKKNENTLMVTTCHLALKHLSEILREKYHQDIENDTFKDIFPQKPITAFCKKSPPETTL